MHRDESFLDALNDVLAHHYAERRLTTARIAAGIGISERHLQRKVVELTGRTPSQYLRAYRIRRAVSLLQDGWPVGEVAKAVGFTSHAYFSSCFKAEFGATPSRFREGWERIEPPMSRRQKKLALERAGRRRQLGTRNSCLPNGPGYIQRH